MGYHILINVVDREDCHKRIDHQKRLDHTLNVLSSLKCLAVAVLNIHTAIRLEQPMESKMQHSIPKKRFLSINSSNVYVDIRIHRSRTESCLGSMDTSE